VLFKSYASDSFITEQLELILFTMQQKAENYSVRVWFIQIVNHVVAQIIHSVLRENTKDLHVQTSY
jgi:hypothetical protein